MKNLILRSIFFLTAFFALVISSSLKAGVGNTVILIGTITTDYKAKGYISFKNKLNQTLIFPMNYLETVNKAKIDPTESKTYVFQIPDKDYLKIHEHCLKTFKNDKAMLDRCPGTL